MLYIKRYRISILFHIGTDVIFMRYSLGIDAGGTYTDAIIVENSDGSIVEFNKSLTTYPDMTVGIKNALESIDTEHLKQVSLVSVSTTLATNTVLEKTGDPVGLILVGDHPSNNYPALDILETSGGHDNNGEEIENLNFDEITEFVNNVKTKVSAFAVSSYFSIRNPEHELKIKELIESRTGMPVVCGHNLSQDIGVYERAVTATLNAKLIPIIRQFIESTIQVIKEKDINARMLMLKCDGSVISIQDALDKPIETIFSGPAASLIGASYLTRLDTCAVIDVGGTSTDVSLIKNGVPELSETGAIVGGWKTRVRATVMETSAMGGDSHIWIQDKKLNIGPNKVIPLCYAATKYKNLLDKLKRDEIVSRRTLDENIQPTKYFIRTEKKHGHLTKSEEKLLKVIDYEDPRSFADLSRLMVKPPATQIMNSLIRKRLVQCIGFTPTDALHVLGDYKKWNVEASLIGSKKLGKLNKFQAYEFCKEVKQMFTINMAYRLITFMLPMLPREGIHEMIKNNSDVKFKLDVPVVLLGGPVSAYRDGLDKLIDADIRVPEFASVGNAAGALFGNGIKRLEMMIIPESINKPDKNYLLFSQDGRYKIEDYYQALEFAKEHGKKLVTNHMLACGFNKSDIEIKVNEKKVIPQNWHNPPVETHLVILGVAIQKKGTHDKYMKNNSSISVGDTF